MEGLDIDEIMKVPERYWQNATYSDLLNACLIAQGLFSTAFLITSFVLGSNGYAGFTAVFTGLVYIAYIAFCYYGMIHWKSRTYYGAVLGAGSFLVILSLQTAIFWGEYSRCRPLRWAPRDVQCRNTDAMTSACVFAVFMLLALLAQLLVVFFYKDAILGNQPLNEGVGYAKVALSTQDGSSAAASSSSSSSSSARPAAPVFTISSPTGAAITPNNAQAAGQQSMGQWEGYSNKERQSVDL